MAQRNEALLRDLESLKTLLVAYATGGRGDDKEFRELRRKLLAEPLVKDSMPRFMHTCRALDEFWAFIKGEADNYAARRRMLREAFNPIITRLEEMPAAPVDAQANITLMRFDEANVHAIWQKAIERRITDPEGAITSARTLLEAVCKHILDGRGITYDDKADLPKLYSLASAQLNLSPSQHTEQVFKQILGGCQAVVEGLGALRNRLSDAHARGKKGVKPAARHAELAVNLAGAVATFLVATWEAQNA